MYTQLYLAQTIKISHETIIGEKGFLFFFFFHIKLLSKP